MYASKELSAELYGLIKWDSDELKHHLNGEIYDRPVMQSDLRDDQTMEKNDYFPLYNLGYLVRKLNGSTPVTMTVYKGRTTFYWQDFSETAQLPDKFMHKADTPEDALCGLAIKLFKSGQLTKEGA